MADVVRVLRNNVWMALALAGGAILATLGFVYYVGTTQQNFIICVSFLLAVCTQFMSLSKQIPPNAVAGAEHARARFIVAAGILFAGVCSVTLIVAGVSRSLSSEYFLQVEGAIVLVAVGSGALTWFLRRNLDDME